MTFAQTRGWRTLIFLRNDRMLRPDAWNVTADILMIHHLIIKLVPKLP